jgi:hypothetical protein
MTLYALYQGNDSLIFNGKPYSALDLVGGGLFPIRLLTERGAQQDGSSAVGTKLDERTINMSVLIDASNRAQLVGYKDALAAFIKPNGAEPMQLRATRDDGSVRALDVFTVGIVDFPNTTQARVAAVQRLVLQMQAPDPVPYDPALQNINFSLTAPGGYLIPLKVPLKYLISSSLSSTVTLAYTGVWRTFPTIFISGPATSPVITNLATGDKLDFTGQSIPAGDTWIVDLTYGVKRIFDNHGVAKDYALTNDSNLVTWAIMPDKIAPGGINDIRVVVPSGANLATQVRVEFYRKFPNLD